MLKSIALLFTFFERFITVADKALGIAETTVDVGVLHADAWAKASRLELATRQTQEERAAAASLAATA